MKPSILAVIFLFLLSCAGNKEQVYSESPAPQALSFSGKPLFSKPAEPAVLSKSDSIIDAIKSKGEISEDDFVEIGKQLVGTARYKLAVDNYSEGLSKYPDSYKLLRNRGHRFITLRQLDDAMKDLTKAEALIRSEPDVMEYGLDGKPTATVRHQIWYHIGVCHYLNKDYGQSAAAFEKALATAGDSKNVVGASDWLYNSYMRLGLKDKAESLLAPITPDLDTDREQAYFRRIMLYKGVIKPEELIDVRMAPDKMSVQDVTKLYGLANWYAYHGDTDTAGLLYKTILQSDAWPGFAYAAAEKEVLNR
jgi:tetratricopeptide (TPR) repeat protein